MKRNRVLHLLVSLTAMVVRMTVFSITAFADGAGIYGGPRLRGAWSRWASPVPRIATPCWQTIIVVPSSLSP